MKEARDKRIRKTKLFRKFETYFQVTDTCFRISHLRFAFVFRIQ
jgi:hypothetical protein